MTFSSPSWRSLDHWKGSLNHPKKVAKNCQEVTHLFSAIYRGPITLFAASGVRPGCQKRRTWSRCVSYDRMLLTVWEGLKQPCVATLQETHMYIYIYFTLGKKGKLHLQRCRLGWDIFVFLGGFCQNYESQIGNQFTPRFGFVKILHKNPCVQPPAVISYCAMHINLFVGGSLPRPWFEMFFYKASFYNFEGVNLEYVSTRGILPIGIDTWFMNI